MTALLQGIPHGPHSAQSIQRAYPALLPFQAVIVALWANQRGIGVPRASDAATRPTPQLVPLSPRRFSDHRRKMAASRQGFRHA